MSNQPSGSTNCGKKAKKKRADKRPDGVSRNSALTAAERPSLAVARDIAAKPTSAVRLAKRALVRHKLSGLEAALDYEAAAQMSSFASAEMRQALAQLKQR